MRNYVFYVNTESKEVEAWIITDDEAKSESKEGGEGDYDERNFLGSITAESWDPGEDDEVLDLLDALAIFSGDGCLWQNLGKVPRFLKAIAVSSYKLGLEHGKTDLLAETLKRVEAIPDSDEHFGE